MPSSVMSCACVCVCVCLLEIHVPLGEVAGGEVEMQIVERHDARQQHTLHARLRVLEVVAVHKYAYKTSKYSSSVNNNNNYYCALIYVKRRGHSRNDESFLSLFHCLKLCFRLFYESK